MKFIKKVIFVAISTITLGATTAHADTNDLQKQLQDVFGDTNLVQPEQVDGWVEKGKEKLSEGKEYVKENLPSWKERAADTFEESKSWLESYNKTRGTAAIPAEGFEFFNATTKKSLSFQVYVAVENPTVKKPRIYFVNQSGEELSGFEFKSMFDESQASYKFLKIASARKVRSKIFTEKNIFPDNQFYVWAEIQGGDAKIVRPVPVSKTEFKRLKKAQAGAEFTPLYLEK